MTEAEILALINTYIVANGNNEITANILRPILVAMLEQPNDKIGDLTNLDTTDKSSIVNAINEIFGAMGSSSFTVHSGTDDPNITPPSSFSIGDWYIRSGTSLYQYNGSVWVLLKSDAALALKRETFTYTSPNNTFTVSADAINEIFDVQIGNGCNFDSYATIDNGNEVTIDNSIIFGGESIKIIYT